MKNRFFIPLILLIVLLVIAIFVVILGAPTRSETDKIVLTARQGLKLTEKKEEINLPKEVTLLAVGDIMLSRRVGDKMLQFGYDYPFLEVGEYLKQADFVFGNLETPITPGRQIKTGEMVFRADPEVVNSLKENNFSILSLANNHTPNFGQKGLEDTFKYLNSVGIKYVGAGLNSSEAYRPVYLEKNGIKIAFLAFNDSDVVPSYYGAGEKRAGTALMDLEKLTQGIEEAKNNSDFVVISLHSGSEYTPGPNKSQTEFAHAAIDTGADLVIGHHPHVVQTWEKYKDKYIFYSLGNFIFDQMWSLETRQGLMAKFHFTKNEIQKIELLPVQIADYSQPKVLDSESGQKVINRLGSIEDEKIITIFRASTSTAD